MEPPIHYQKLPVWVPFPWWVTGLQPMDMEGLPVSEDKELREEFLVLKRNRD